MNDKKTIERLKKLSLEARKLIIETACCSKSAHVGSSLSCVDILVALYFYKLRIAKTKWGERDIFVLSKGHAALALYSVLALKKIISRKVLKGYLQDKGTLPAHLDRNAKVGIEVSAGSLGHGFNMALGMAYGYKLNLDKRKVFALIGDGESQEGSIWEGALFASKLNLDNFTAILDYNNLQGYGRPKDICSYEPIAEKWRSFGWKVSCVDGHNFSQIIAALDEPNNGKPKIIIAKTTKGKGVSFMEDQMKWHYFIVTKEFREKAITGLCRRCL